MKIKIIIFIISLCLFSCNGEDECNQIPSTNEFTFNCNNYSIDIGKFSISESTIENSNYCHFLLTNNISNRPFDFVERKNEINLIELILYIKKDYINGIPEGTYNLTDNTDIQPFQVRPGRIVSNGSIYLNSDNGNSPYYNNEGHYGNSELFEKIIIEISKENNKYSISGNIIYDGNVLKLSYNGILTLD